ncbi:Beta-hexosaminidase [Erysiphe neolycopersici]|uniref:Beta-hexosaminidase n=1 Tax=Erysiphe neolycopersici TaxID=212602 RepID=A0A420I3C7_9PEZI|nr:Beta-hexosaminidase [Erysiphe neolycopersici]
MRSPFFITFCLILSFQLNASIWPAPKSLTTGSSSVWISNNVSFVYKPGSNAYISRKSKINSLIIINEAIARTRKNLFLQNFVPWKLHPRNRISEFEPDAKTAKTYISQVTITQTGTDNEASFRSVANEVDESYSISISDDGTSEITATSYHGVLYALESFSQLFYQHSSGIGFYTNLAPAKIIDAPKFPHRGINMDVARSWFPVKSILNMIDALAINKFNRLHLHVTDAQSWPLEIPSMPELAEKGAYMTGLSYSASDLTRIQDHGLRRGVEVILEIDMPGHTSSISYAYPDLIAGFAAKPWNTYCAEPPCGSLKLNSTSVTSFVQKLLADVIPRVSPYSAYFHTGGDEVNKNVYLLDDTVQSKETSVLAPLLQKFVDRNHDQLRNSNIIPIVWEEMALDWNLTLGSDVIVQVWLSSESVAKVTSKGLKVLTGDYQNWYLDCGMGQWLNFENGESFQKYYPFQDYCAPYKNWRLMYAYDPLSGIPEEQHNLVLGGEVHIWAEQVDPVNLETMIWLRAAAAGEVLWSGRQDENGQNRSQIQAAPRLAEWRERMVQRGISANPVQMTYCTQADGRECSL